ncbi:histidine triad nucleotide-binding protein 3-like protein [Hesseltinella vesiculosa]|uniref:Histidine triad nucleotide-binding protein 3-like protein n=1 Tax=Hesseltinella vesiculosa TaxID=101127 RepID=A0A1X2GQ85_9FUNG|nr:histidine triad nucleotide-binding protein 3-like protein [Hesseltinella vesiculosa]
MLGCFGKSECIFCDVTEANGFRIVHQTDDLIAFHDRSPAGQMHVLIVPRKHIKNMNHLKKDDAALLRSMMALGHTLLEENGYDLKDKAQYRLGFHRPPFNSVQHLHLHVIGLPFRNRFKTLKFKPGMVWYTDGSEVLKNLDA